MRRLVVGVIGHVDHGKTALVRALTGTDTDRLPEEKRRGISIALGFAHFRAGADAEIDLIDMPGHERFVRTMIAGATGIDAVLLVVAANEGIKPQTVEHVDVAALLGLRRAVVAVSKTDLVTPAAAAQAGAHAAQLLAASGLQAGPPVMTSAVTGDGMPALRAALIAAATGSAVTDDGIAFLPIDRAFSVPGHGTVVTGTLAGAPIRTGDALELLPLAQSVRVRGVQVHGSRVAAGLPGQRVAVNLRDIEPGQVPRGAALAAVGAAPLSAWLGVRLRSVTGAPKLRTGTTLRLLLGTAEHEARLRLLDRDVLEPGAVALAQLHAATPIATLARARFVLRLPSPARTVAGGTVLETESVRQRRHTPSVLQRLAGLASLPPEGIVQQELALAGAAGLSLQRLSRLTALAPARVAALVQASPAVIARGLVAVTRDALDGVRTQVLATLAQGGGLPRERLLAVLPNTSEPVLEEALRALLASGAVRQNGPTLAIPRPAEDRARAAQDATLTAQIAQALRQGGLTPPDPAGIAASPLARRALDRLIRAGEAVRTHDRAQKRDVVFHREAIELARRRLAPVLEGSPGMLVGEIGAALGISRKYCVPLLEHLDAIRFTRRIQDRRVLALAPVSR